MSESNQKKGHVAVHLDVATVARLDALAPRFSTPSRRASRSEVLREMILLGLRIEESKPEKGSSPDDGKPTR